MYFSSHLTEFTAESKFSWKISNLSKIDWKKHFIIKSNEVFFKEANARWHLKLIPFIYDQKSIFLVSKFYLYDDSNDENAKYKFDITLKDGSLLESKVLTTSMKGKSVIEYEMTKYIPIENEDVIEMTPRVFLETMKMQEPEIEIISDNEASIELLPDNFQDEKDSLDSQFNQNLLRLRKIFEKKDADLNVGERKSKENSVQVRDNGNDSEYDFGDVEVIPISKMSDYQLTEKISEIYLANMKQVADSSGRLLIAAWRDDDVDLLSECVMSLASQITKKNFIEIWEIGAKLKIKELKDKVINFAVANRNHLAYDNKMSPELMLQIVRAID